MRFCQKFNDFLIVAFCVCGLLVGLQLLASWGINAWQCASHVVMKGYLYVGSK